MPLRSLEGDGEKEYLKYRKNLDDSRINYENS